MTNAKTFALIGAAGFVATRHLDAIKHVGGELVAAVDPHDSVGILDSYFPDCRFFTSPERFDRFLNKQSGNIDYVVVCSPNWLHDAHCRWALRSGADAICEKPLVLNPWNVDQLSELEVETGRTIHPVLQLRHHPQIRALKARIEDAMMARVVRADITYITHRGRWYLESWKSDDALSGGILMNLGIHFFDMMCWLFGSPRSVHAPGRDADPRRHLSGTVDFDRASTTWRLSTRREDLPTQTLEKGGHAFRNIVIDGESVADYSHGFTSLHDLVYRSILDGDGLSLADARPGIALVHEIRRSMQPSS